MTSRLIIILLGLFLFACNNTDLGPKKPEPSKPNVVKAGPVKSTTEEPAKTTAAKPNKVEAMPKPDKVEAMPKPNKVETLPKPDKVESMPKPDPVKLDEEILSQAQVFFDDPEIQLLSKTKEELEDLGKTTQDNFNEKIKGLGKDDHKKLYTEVAFSLLKLLILQENDVRINKSIDGILKNADLPTIINFIKDMENKSDKISSLVANNLPKINDKTRDAHKKLTDISFDYARLIGTIKGKLSAAARDKSVTLPDFL